MQALLRKNTTILQLEDSPTICSKSMIDDVTICVDSWEYPTDFIFLREKK